MQDIKAGKVSSEIVALRKPLVCEHCTQRFPDEIFLSNHKCNSTVAFNQVPAIDPKSLTILELKKLLTQKGGSTSGNKATLSTRLENILAYEML